jgi:hypothetical protein
MREIDHPMQSVGVILTYSTDLQGVSYDVGCLVCLDRWVRYHTSLCQAKASLCQHLLLHHPSLWPLLSSDDGEWRYYSWMGRHEFVLPIQNSCGSRTDARD